MKTADKMKTAGKMPELSHREHDWLKAPLRLVQFNFPESKPGGKYSPAQCAEEVKRIHANAVHMAWDDRKRQQLVREYHKRGIKVFAYIGGVSSVKGKREWFQKKIVPKAKGRLPTGYSGCCNTPFRDELFRRIKAALKETDVDGIFLDGPGFYEGTCYCPCCQKKFRRDFGRSIPLSGKKLTGIYKKFIRWRYDCINEFLREAKEAAASVRDVPLYMNSRGIKGFTRGCGRYVREQAEYEDIIAAEAYLGYHTKEQFLIQRPLWAVSVTAKFMVAAARGKQTLVFLLWSWSPWKFRPQTEGTLKLSIFQTAANQSGPGFEYQYPTVKESPPEANFVKEAFGFLKRNNQYYEGAQSAADVGVVFSRRCGDYYDQTPNITLVGDWELGHKRIGGEDASKSYFYAFRGVCDALLREHIPFDLVLDEDLEQDLFARYKVLVMPNVGCLNDKQTENIRNFVRQGGGLLCSYETSLYDELGKIRKNFSLADVIGVDFKEKMGPFPARYSYHQNARSPIVKGVRKIFPSPEYILSLEPGADSKQIVHYGSRINWAAGQKLECVLGAGEGDYPLVFTHRYGTGRVCYFAGNFEERYWSKFLPEIRRLISNCVRWSGRDRLTVDVKSPGMVEVVLNSQPEKKRLILHLLNYTGEMIIPIDKILTLSGIEIRLKDVNVRKIQALSLKKQLPYRKKNNATEFILPELKSYEVLIIEYK